MAGASLRRLLGPRETVAGLLRAGWLRHFGWSEPAAPPGSPWDGGWAAESWLAEAFWLESGWPEEIGRDFGWNLAGPGKLAGILAGIWLARGNWQGFWLAGQISDFARKSGLRPKPLRTTNFHLKDPGTFQLEFLTLVTMV